jgi:hypothetical protein
MKSGTLDADVCRLLDRLPARCRENRLGAEHH